MEDHLKGSSTDRLTLPAKLEKGGATASSYGQVSKDMPQGTTLKSHYKRDKQDKDEVGQPLTPKLPIRHHTGRAHMYFYLYRYKAVKIIGRGTYAKVYKVKHMRTGKAFAAKIIKLGQVSDNYKLKFMPREVQIMKKIKHKNIIELIEIVDSGWHILIFMELAINGSIGDFIKIHGPITELMAKQIFVPIAKALFFMHSNGIAHRDIKVENILLDKVDYN